MPTKSSKRLKRIERAGSKPSLFAKLEKEADDSHGVIWGVGLLAALVLTVVYMAVMIFLSIFFDPGLAAPGTHGDESAPSDWFWRSWVGVYAGSYVAFVGFLSIFPMCTQAFYSLPKDATFAQRDAVQRFRTYDVDEQSLARPVYLAFLSRDENYAARPYAESREMWDRMTVAINKRRELYAEQDALESYEAAHALAALESHNNDLSKDLKERTS